MGQTPDLYRVLQVDPAAEPEVIAAAYRRLAEKYHPDRNSQSTAARLEAEARMKQINQAYDVLKNPTRRSEYDRTRDGRGRAVERPELEVLPAEVVLRDVDARARELKFTVRIRQVAGPAYDPARHRIQLLLGPPWDAAGLSWRWSQDRLPADVEFTLDVSRIALTGGRRLSGDIELQVKVEV